MQPFVKLSEEQQHILDDVGTGQNILITGVAGTGKSFTIEQIRKQYQCSLTATTGVAALNIGGSTIHRWSGMGIGADSVADIIQKIIHSQKHKVVKSSIQHCERLIIDEVSMLSYVFFDKMNDVFKAVRNDQSRPFGGIQLILTGDFLQLPPVRKPGSPDDFCFVGYAWKESKIKVHMLTKVFRQKDENFVRTLFNLRKGICTPEDFNLISSRSNCQKPYGLKPLIIYPRNIDVDKINKQEIDKINSQGMTWDAQDLVEESIDPMKFDKCVEQLDKDCLAPKKLELKEGAQVMLLKNINTEIGLVNGSMGTVKEMEKDSVRVYFPRIEESHSIKRENWEYIEDKKVIMTRRQIPLRLAYAITVHKCQGMTLDAIECDLAGTFSAGQAYVALSRAKTLEGLYVRGFKPEIVFADDKALKFYKDLGC